jgi:DNA adenine methylase
MKPFIKYIGGKTQLLPIIKEHLPKFEKNTKYIEPFVGGGAVFLSLISKYYKYTENKKGFSIFNNNEKNISNIIINDINSDVINIYNLIKNDIYLFIDKLEELQNIYNNSLTIKDTSDIYYNIRDKYNNDELDIFTKSIYFFFLTKTGYNGLIRYNNKGKFNVPYNGVYYEKIGKNISNLNLYNRNNLLDISKYLEHIIILNNDYNTVLDYVDNNTFLYLDPPYRKLQKNSNNLYINCFNDEDQIMFKNFIDKINDIGARFMLSNSDPKNINNNDNFFDDLYKNYNIKRIPIKRLIGSKNNTRKIISELLITNY